MGHLTAATWYFPGGPRALTPRIHPVDTRTQDRLPGYRSGVGLRDRTEMLILCIMITNISLYIYIYISISYHIISYQITYIYLCICIFHTYHISCIIMYINTSAMCSCSISLCFLIICIYIYIDIMYITWHDVTFRYIKLHTYRHRFKWSPWKKLINDVPVYRFPCLPLQKSQHLLVGASHEIFWAILPWLSYARFIILWAMASG